jgi:phage terminase small subunit
VALTPKQERFVAEYLIDLNATAAYKRAGYDAKGKSAEVNASRLLSNDKVAQAVKSAIDKRSDDLGIDAKYVLTTIRNTIERCSQAVDVRDKDGESIGEYKFDSGAVLKGAELLGRHLKMFTDKAEVSGPNGGPVEFTKIVREIVRPK